MKLSARKIMICLLLLSLFLLQGCRKMDSGENGIPSAPKNLQASVADGGGLLYWSEVDNASAYKIYVSIRHGGPYEYYATVKAPMFTIPNLQDARTYYVVVTAENAFGESGYSNEVSVNLAQGSLQYVTITDKDSYYAVTLDLQNAGDHTLIGKQYGAAIAKAVPNYQELLDSYFSEVLWDSNYYQSIMQNALTIKQNVPQEYQNEMEGMASTLANTTQDRIGDGLLSKNEIYMFNLLPDALRDFQCSALSVYGSYSETGSTITERALDWYGGSTGQLDKLQAVVTIKNSGNSVCLIGYLGYLGSVTGFNDDKVFGAILDSFTRQAYTANSRRSYPMDLRYALEHETTLDGVASFMTDTAHNYAFNHLIFLSDPNRSGVVENNFSGTGANMHRALRTSDSELNNGITWGFSNAVAAVNSFMLRGNHDNHFTNPDNPPRWETIKAQLALKGDRVSVNEIKEIASFDGENGPGAMSDGDLYNWLTRQIVIFEPQTLSLQVFFAPKSGILPQDPTFVPVTVSFN